MKTTTCLLLASMAVGLCFAGSTAVKTGAPTKINFQEYQKKEALKNWPKAKSSHGQKSTSALESVNLNQGHSIKMMKRDAAAASAAAGVNFRCGLLYSDNWDDDTYAYGAYDFNSADDPITFTKRYVNTDAPQNGGGFFYGDKFVFTSYVSDSYGYDYNVTTYVVNTTTWRVEQEVEQDDLTAMASDFAFDPIEQVAFGCFYNSDGGGYWGYMDPSSLDVTLISELDGELVAVAATELGEIYAITDNGVLVKVDKYSGELTTIGATGISPYYLQSATFAEDGTLYWAAGFTDGSSGLFTVDITNGHVSLVQAFDGDEEVVSLYALPDTPADAAPAAVSDLAAVFTADDLAGDVTFTVPTVTYDNSKLSGTVSCSIIVDGVEVKTVEAQAGEKVTTPVQVASAGVHVFAVRLSNEAGAGEKTSLAIWVGIDRPVAVTDLTLEKTGDFQAKLTWIAPTGSVNGGYFDLSRVSYKITRLSDNVVVATGLRATTFIDDIDLPEGQAYVTYKVTACADDVEGQSAVSNGAVFGSAYKPSVTFALDTEAEYNLFTVIDNNETLNLDSGQWQYSASAGCAGYVCGTKDGDDWFITPNIQLQSDRYYTFEYDVCCYSDYWPDKYEVFIGEGATIAAMTTRLVDETDIYWDEYRHVSVKVKVDKDGVYNFGFHALSEGGGAFFMIDNVAITESYALKAPAQVANFKAVAGAEGKLYATISFDAPTRAADNSTLDAPMSAKIYQDGNYLTTIENIKPGESASYTETNLNQGNITYTVVPENSYGIGIEAERTVYVGIDTPAEPTVHVSLDGTHPVITWEAPEGRGTNGGYVDNNSLTYLIYRVKDGSIIAQDLTGFSYTDSEAEIPLDGDQSLYQYGVYAMSSAGYGYPGSAFVIGGAEYALPYKESFPNGKSSHLWVSSGTLDDYWAIATDWVADPQDGDGGLLLLTPYTAGSESTIFTGKIDMNGAKNPTLSFYLCTMTYENNGFIETDPEDDTLVIQVGDSKYDVKDYYTINPSEFKAGQYTLVTIPLDDYVGEDFIYFGFHANNVSAQTPLLLDNIVVRSNYDYNLAISDVEVPSSVNATENFSLTATVLNDGAKAIDNYSVVVRRGEKQVAKQDVTESLAAGKSATVELTINAASEWADNETLTVQVVAEGDEYAEDDTAEVSLDIVRPNMPAVTDLKGEGSEGNYTLTWSAPDLNAAYAITESFEDYAHGTMRNIGDWSLYDGDGEYGYGDIYAGDDYVDLPHPFNAQSFQVVDVNKLDIDIAAHPEWAAHSGDKMIISIYNNWENDDWLISPKLSGNEQVISFYAKTGKEDSGDKIQVYYSAEGTETSDFALLDARKLKLNAEWTKYEYTVPEETTYFAIRYAATSGYVVMIDDVTFEPAATDSDVALEIVGYNLYRGDEKVNNEVITDTTYELTDAPQGEYTVTVVYNVGESAKSNAVAVLNSGVQIIENDKVSPATIYDLKGRRVTAPRSGQIYIIDGVKVRYTN